MTKVCVLCVKPLLKYPSPRISFHVFPACPKKRQIWLKQCRLTNKDVLPNRKICSFHFEPTCFKSNVKRRILYPDAVPTIFGNGYVKTKKRPLKIVKGRQKNCNKKGIAGQNRQSRDASLTRAAKKGISTSNRKSRDASLTRAAKKGISTSNRKSRNASLTRAAKKGISTSNRKSRDVLPIKPATKVFDRVKSNATNRKRKLDKLDEPITKLKKNKSSFMSLLKLVKIQFSLANRIK